MITSTSNTRIKSVIRLLSQAKIRREEHSYVVEGMKMYKEAPVDMIRQVLLTESAFSRLEGDIEVPYELVSDDVYKKMSDTKTPQGIMCVMEMMDYSLGDFAAKDTGKLKGLVLEGVQDPGNIGTMIRTAEGAGYDFILADRKTADIYNPKVIRSTMGSIFRVPFIYSEDLIGDLNVLKKSGVVSYAAHLKGDKFYDEVEYDKRRVILIGNEGMGLSDEISAVCDCLVKIPMEGKLESLNAAVAAALMMYRR